MGFDDIKRGILAVCDKADAGADKAVAMAPGVIRRVIDSHFLTRHLPGFAKDRIVDMVMSLVRKAADQLHKLAQVFRDFANRLPSPEQLRAGAERITEGVVKPAHTMANTTIDQEQLLALRTENWDSSGRDSYERSESKQPQAVAEISRYAQAVAKVLEETADSWDEYLNDAIKIEIELGLAVGGLIVAIVTFETGVGPIIGLIVAIGSLLLAIYDLIEIFTSQADRASATVEELADQPSVSTWPSTAFAQ